MRYSLSSRFRGTLIGAAVGELLGYGSWVSQHSSTPAIPAVKLPDNEIKFVNLALLGTKSLIRQGRFDVSDWRNTFGKNCDLQPLQLASEHAVNQISTKAVISTLPIALFYHEDEIKLRQNLQSALIAVGQDDPESRDAALAIGYAIAQSLQEKLQIKLIPQTIAFLEGSQTGVAQKLQKVNNLLQQNAGLERVVTQVSQDSQLSTSIALAFYCYLSTLEDFNLGVRRAVQTSNQSQITSAITGAFSGAYNSAAGIGSALKLGLWRYTQSVHPTNSIQQAGEVKTETQMLELCDLLVAVWSGVYEQAIDQTELTTTAAIAAPRVIRFR